MLSLCGTRRTQKKRDNMTDYTEAGNAANGAKMANELLEARETIRRLQDELGTTKQAEIKDLQDTGRALDDLRQARRELEATRQELNHATRALYATRKEFREQLQEAIRDLFLDDELTRTGAESLAESFDIELEQEVTVTGTVEFSATYTVGLLDADEFDPATALTVDDLTIVNDDGVPVDVQEYTLESARIV
jgi:hypothetical protein